MGRDKRMTQKSRWGKIPIHHTGMAALLPYLVIFVMGMVLTLSEYNYLARVEEQNLFLHTPLFFSQSMVVPGGLLSWAGAFLTQMLHYPALGWRYSASSWVSWYSSWAVLSTSLKSGCA